MNVKIIIRIKPVQMTNRREREINALSMNEKNEGFNLVGRTWSRYRLFIKGLSMNIDGP